jgi:hypothetical protein
MADGENQQPFDFHSDPDFQGLPVTEKHKVLLSMDPDYKALPAPEQAKALNTIHYGASQEPKPSTWERLTSADDPGAREFAEKHPIFGPPARVLSAIGGAVPGLLGSVYHAVADKPTEEENKMFEGHTRIPGELTVERLTGAPSIVQGAKDWANPQTRPTARGALSVLPEALGTGIGTVAAGEMAGAAIPKISAAAAELPGAVKTGFKNKLLTPAVPPGLSDVATENLAEPAARRGVEKIFRSANPPGGDISFREHLATAAPDLAEIEREAPLGKAGKTGGIVKPDMRIRQTVDKIGDRLEKIWTEQRQPQIDRNAEAHTMTREQLLGGLSEDEAKTIEKKLDTTIPENINLQQADNLLKKVNARLRKSEGMTPEDKALAMELSPVLENINDMKESLHENIGRTLEDRGEQGIKEFNRRYGALSEVRDAIRNRMNPTETIRLLDDMRIYGGLRGPGILERLHVKPSAGRLMQKGLEELGGTELRPREFTPNPPRVAGLLPPITPTLAPTADTSGPIRGGEQPIVWTPEMIEKVARERAEPPPAVAPEHAQEGIGSVTGEQQLGARGTAGTRFGPKGLLPAPKPEGVVGRLPTLSGPVTNVPWGIPNIQPRPGWEPLPPTELLGPWGPETRGAVSAAPTAVKPMVPPENATIRTGIRMEPPAGEPPAAKPVEGVLPGMEKAVEEQKAGAAKVQGEDLTREANTPKSIEAAAGEMETKSPLFRGTAASPQRELLEPPKAEPAAPVEKPPTPEEIADAEGLIKSTIDILQSSDRGGQRVFTPMEAGEVLPPGSRRGGSNFGTWRGVGGGRNLMGWLENISMTPRQMERALAQGADSPTYQRLLDAAVKWIRRQELTPEEKAGKASAAEERFKNFKPPASKFVNLKPPEKL